METLQPETHIDAKAVARSKQSSENVLSVFKCPWDDFDRLCGTISAAINVTIGNLWPFRVSVPFFACVGFGAHALKGHGFTSEGSSGAPVKKGLQSKAALHVRKANASTL